MGSPSRSAKPKQPRDRTSIAKPVGLQTRCVSCPLHPVPSTPEPGKVTPESPVPRGTRSYSLTAQECRQMPCPFTCRLSPNLPTDALSLLGLRPYAMSSFSGVSVQAYRVGDVQIQNQLERARDPNPSRVPSNAGESMALPLSHCRDSGSTVRGWSNRVRLRIGMATVCRMPGNKRTAPTRTGMTPTQIWMGTVSITSPSGPREQRRTIPGADSNCDSRPPVTDFGKANFRPEPDAGISLNPRSRSRDRGRPSEKPSRAQMAW